MYPLIDDYMTYNYEDHRYVLESKYIFDKYNVILSNVLLDASMVEPFLDMVSVQVYNYIHDYNVNNSLQDFIIAKTENGRRIVKNAMEQQFLYLASVGDVSRMLEEARRTDWIDINAEKVLSQNIPEIGCSILYPGTLRFGTNDNSRW